MSQQLGMRAVVFVLSLSLVIACGKDRGGEGDGENLSMDPSNPDYYNKYGEGNSSIPGSIGDSTGSGTGSEFDTGGTDLNAPASAADVAEVKDYLQNLIGNLRANDPGDGGAMLSMLMGLAQQLGQRNASNKALGMALFAALIAKHCAKGAAKAGGPPAHSNAGGANRRGMGASKVATAKRPKSKAMSVAMCFAKAMKKIFPKIQVIIVKMSPEAMGALKDQVTGGGPGGAAGGGRMPPR